MVRPAGPAAAICLVAALAATAPGTARMEARRGLDAADPVQRGAPVQGGHLVATIRAEPRSFNRYTSRDFVSEVISFLTQARLVRVNRQTQQVEPSLAESWSCTPDARSCTLNLRKGVSFSDGAPFTSADVLFAFQAIYDPSTSSPLAESVVVGGKPIEVTAPDMSTIVVRFPSPFGPGVRVLDNLPILPRHKLEAALKAGALGKTWGTDTKPDEIAGLGPFVIREYLPGQRLVFSRNPRFWRTDASGQRLPYLDALTLEVVPDQNAELLRLESGQADLTQTELRPDDFAMLKRAEGAGRLKLVDAGLAFDADCFWFNLRTAAKANDPRRAWLQSLELRRAVSLAVDRKAFVNAVFLGAADPIWGPVSPANRTWYPPAGSGVIPSLPFDPAAARALLAGLGLSDRNNDSMLEDASGSPARFTLLTQKGPTALERGAAVIRDDLKKVGIGVDVVALEVGALVDRLMKADYDAIYYRFLTTDSDPALNLDFWLSSGSAHVWDMDQKQPATPWERELDAVMLKQASDPNLAERQKLFSQAQKILADHVPVLYFAVPRVFVAMNSRLSGTLPAAVRPLVLWAPETIWIQR